jgi:hypothetical protein
MASRDPVSDIGRLDWRVWLGLTLTAIWLILGVLYISSTIGWQRFLTLRVDQLGSFLEGAFAPLAFLWLVVGYFLQKKGLEHNTIVLQAQLNQVERATEQAVIQSEKMAASELHARQETFLKIAQTVRGQLGTIIGLLLISSQGAGASGRVTSDDQARMFAQLSQNDPEVFSRRMLELHIEMTDERERFELFYGTPIRARHANNFIYTFERLVARALDVDPDGMISDSLYSNAHGLVYRIAKRHQAAATAELADRTHTGTHIEL